MVRAASIKEDRLPQIFDSIAEAYDGWYNRNEGQAIFKAELKCLRTLCANFRGRWLEVGVGTGRFARELGIGLGVDPSMPMLRIAGSHGILTTAGCAEALPFRGHSFDGVLLALTLCFIEDSNRALRECARVLRPKGKLILGVIQAESAWGRAYETKGAEGHLVFASARFPNIPEVMELIDGIGLVYRGSASTLFWSPGNPPEIEPLVKTSFSPKAGFIGLLFERTGNVATRYKKQYNGRSLWEA